PAIRPRSGGRPAGGAAGRPAGRPGDSVAGRCAGPLIRIVFGTPRRAVLCGQMLLFRVCLRDAQRAEYLADELAAGAAGSDAGTGLVDTLVLRDTLYRAVRWEARQGGPVTGWFAAARAARDAAAGRLPGMRQLSVRDEVAMSAIHPP